MKTATFIHTLKNNTGKKLLFRLPDATYLEGDLHITEIKHQSVKSVDCGSNAHSFNETVIQLWINEQSDKQEEWTVAKAVSIIDKVGNVKSYAGASEVFIEFGDSTHSTIKYSVEQIQDKGESIVVYMKVNPTVCKPRAAMGQAVGCC